MIPQSAVVVRVDRQLLVLDQFLVALQLDADVLLGFRTQPGRTPAPVLEREALGIGSVALQEAEEARFRDSQRSLNLGAADVSPLIRRQQHLHLICAELLVDLDPDGTLFAAKVPIGSSLFKLRRLPRNPLACPILSWKVFAFTSGLTT